MARLLAWMAFAGVVTFAACARAEPLPSSCRAGLLLGVPDDDARDVVAAVCSAAKERGTTGLVRVSVVAAGAQVRVAVARMADATGVEQTAHADATSIAVAVKIAPGLLDAVDPARPTPAPAPAPAPAPEPAPAPPVAVEAPSAPAEPEDKAAPPLQTKAGPPAAMLGVHGAATFLSNGASAAGGGASIGVDHKSAQGFIDFVYGRASLGRGTIDDLRLTMGARLKLSQSSVVPVVGGGWSYSDHEAKDGSTWTKGNGIGVFGELGLLVPIEKHQLSALGRLDLGLYHDTTTEPVTSDGYTYRRTTSAGGFGTVTPSYALLLGYGYVFR